MKERQPDVSEKVKPSSEILYKKLEEGFISMVCTRICEALINANRLYNFGPGQNQYIRPIRQSKLAYMYRQQIGNWYVSTSEGNSVIII